MHQQCITPLGKKIVPAEEDGPGNEPVVQEGERTPTEAGTWNGAAAEPFEKAPELESATCRGRI